MQVRAQEEVLLTTVLCKMVVIEYKDGTHFYMDKRLAKALDRIRETVLKKDDDYVLMIDGEERSGKSVLAMQVAKKIDPEFTINQMCMNPEEFTKQINEISYRRAIVFDESYRGLGKRGVLSQVHNLLVSKMMEMGQKNLFVIIVIPTFFMLDRYVALFRAGALMHVYKDRSGKRGRWISWKKQGGQLKALYDIGYKNYSYGFPKSRAKGRFSEQYVIDEQSYRNKKRKALRLSVLEQKKQKSKAEVRFTQQRNALAFILRHKFKLKYPEISKLCKEIGLSFTSDAIRVGVNTFKEQKAKEMAKNESPIPENEYFKA